ncbi:MAG: hypothetical protein PHI39_10475, partial [Kiritimatiellae bacterium]|nr:hypothetical protein [Kiritimatiellia bacterium]
KIYKPSGEITVRKERIVTPHNFLPERVVSYDFKIGILDDGFSGIGEGNFFSQGYVAGGITGNITLKAGAACFSGEQKVHYFSSVYARIKKRYLMDIYVSPGIKYGFGMEGCYPEGHNWKISYTRFPDERLLNLRLFKEELFAGFLLPFNFLNIKSGLRMSYRKKRFRKGTGSDFSGSIFARLRRITLRADYRGRFNTCSGSESYADGYAVAYVSYIFPGVHSVPFIVRGSMLNAKVAYDPVFCNLNSAGIRFSRALSGRGRFHIDFDYTFPSHSLSLHALINIYLNKFRILSVFRKMNDNYLSRQNICGSIASLSAGGEKVLWSESEQAGCAGVSVIMFVDSNENGKYDENEEIVPADAFRINRSADIKLTTEGILHIGRLVSYQSYNARIIQSEMQDPLLAPLKSSFSFIADPNRFKLIKIPLYRTGVIEGRVILQEEGLSRPAGGLKLIIEAVGNDVKKIINTFSDGSFYAMGILPGRYLLKIDKEQLDHLDLAGSPEIREIEIKACADGDFHTDINFILSHKSNPVKRERND